MERTAHEWIDLLQLKAHIEGGYYKEVLKSNTQIKNEEDNARSLYTSIYFLLEEGNPSHLHRLQSDEVWYFHAGNSLTVHLIEEDGRYHTMKLGDNLAKGEQLQALVPKGTIFGSTVDEAGGYALVSCMVAPGFEYEDFELLKRSELMCQYPEHHAIIERLTREDVWKDCQLHDK